MKFSKYIYIKEINNTTLALYHSLLIRTVFITKNEYSQINKFLHTDIPITEELKKIIKHLYCNYFIINTDDDDINIYNKCVSLIPEAAISNAYIVVTENCNFNCKYCFISKAVQNEKTNKSMSLDTVCNVAHLMQRTYERNKSKYDKTITFYGGEPLMNIQAIKYFFQEIDKIKEQGLYWPNDVKYAIITNGTLITTEILSFLSNRHVALSISYDVNETSSQRLMKNGNDSQNEVLDKIKLCHAFGYPFSLSVTISEKMVNDPKRIVEELIELNPTTIAFNLLIPNEQSNHTDLYYESATDFMIEAFKVLREHGIYEDRVMRKVQAFENSKIFLYDCCASGGNQYVIEPNGRIGICHGYLNNLKYFHDDVTNSNFEFTKDSNFRYWRRRTPILMAQCQDCECIGICGGGCPYAAEYKYKSIYDTDTRFCIHAKRILNWMLNDLYDNITKNNKTHQIITSN